MLSSLQYTAAGGLYISILTDQVQAVLSLVLLFVAYIYVAATFREPLGPLPSELGTGNYTGARQWGISSLLAALLSP